MESLYKAATPRNPHNIRSNYTIPSPGDRKAGVEPLEQHLLEALVLAVLVLVGFMV